MTSSMNHETGCRNDVMRTESFVMKSWNNRLIRCALGLAFDLQNLGSKVRILLEIKAKNKSAKVSAKVSMSKIWTFIHGFDAELHCGSNAPIAAAPSSRVLKLLHVKEESFGRHFRTFHFYTAWKCLLLYMDSMQNFMAVPTHQSPLRYLYAFSSYYT